MEQIKQRKIVFLVYKAGWWGCFDSLYRRLSQDEMNECYVIPIPYYERRAGIIDYSKRHYEAHNLPEDIPVTDYNVFHLSEQNPDIIYIHNPYDGQSPIDTVDIEYYSYNLKKCTDSLVYIPHMLYLDGVPEQLKSSVVYQNVDQILIANKVVANAFHHVPSEKLVISASPMVDYLEKLSLNEPSIPEEWTGMLPNGRDFEEKRVILYHVGYTELYYGTERAVAKIKYVIEYIQSRKDVILIWKPDLEIEARLVDLPKGVASEYLKLKQRFLNDRLGILDETEDEAIVSVLTDAYIGDYHPMINLFGLQGKPIILPDKECGELPADEELCSVSFLDFTIDENQIWFVADEYNLLCKMELESGKVEVIDKIPNESGPNSINFCGIIKRDNRVYLNPYNSEGFMIYDTLYKVYTTIYLPEKYPMNFDYIVPYKDYLFLKAKDYPAIIRYQTLTNELNYYSDWVEELERYVVQGDENEPYFLWGVVVRDNILMLASSKANVVMQFDMETGKYKIYEVGPAGSKYFGMEYDGKNYWMIPYLGNKLISWNPTSAEWKVYNDVVDQIEELSIPFRAIVKHENSLMLFPFQADFGLKIKLENKVFEKWNMNVPYSMSEFKSEYYKKACTAYNTVKALKQDIVLAEAMYDFSIDLMDLKEEKSTRFPCRIPLEMAKQSYYRWIRLDRETTCFPCAISSAYTLRTVVDYCSEEENLISENEKVRYYSKVERE